MVTKEDILARMQKYCALQDRSVQKIWEKLIQIPELSDTDKSEIVESLIEDQFLDDDRFAANYVKSMVNQKKWGKLKIKQGLIRHKIANDILEKSLNNINHGLYINNLKYLYQTKKKNTTDKSKIIRYLQQKGYLFHEIIEILQ